MSDAISENISSLKAVSPRMAKKLATEYIWAGLVPYIEGSPGIGKTEVVEQIADELNLKLLEYSTATGEPVDVTGLPDFEDGKAVFRPFKDNFPTYDVPLPTKPDGKSKYDGWLIFLDEMNAGERAMQAAFFKVLLNRKMGLVPLHERVAFIGAGNLETDNAIVNPLSTPMQSRLAHVRMETSYDDWVRDVAIVRDYDTRLMAYLSMNPDKLMDFRPDHNDGTFCCPRTWGFANRLVKDKPIDITRFHALAGVITSGVASDFISFVEAGADLVSFDEIMKNPSGARVPMSRSGMWMTVSGLIQKIDRKNFTALVAYINQYSMDFRILFFRGALIRDPSLRTHPDFVDAMISLQRYLS